MKINRILAENRSGIAVAVAVVIILFPLGYSLASYVFTLGARDYQPFLEMPDKRYQECVRDTEYMRFQHMTLLKEIREEVIREGKRGEIGLSGCRDCHTSREKFCNRCHNAVSLNVDCFGCHYYPEAVSGK